MSPLVLKGLKEISLEDDLHLYLLKFIILQAVLLYRTPSSDR